LLKVENDPLPPLRRCKDKNLPQYEFLNKFKWNGLCGRSFSERGNIKLSQREGHGLGCTCRECASIKNKEKKVKRDTQEKQPISILHEIASQEGAKIDLWVTCMECNGRFKESCTSVKNGTRQCPHCNSTVHSTYCMYGWSWNDEYLEGVKGAPNLKEAKRLSAEKALSTLGRKYNYSEQIVRCREGKKGLPKDPGKYYLVADNGEFTEYTNKGKTLREYIFTQHKRYQDIAHEISPNYEWHVLDKDPKGAKLESAISSENLKDPLGRDADEKAPQPPVPNQKKGTCEKMDYWDEWNTNEKDRPVEIVIKIFYNGGVDEKIQEISLKYDLETLKLLIFSQFLEDLPGDVKNFYDVIFRRKGEKRFSYLYDRRYVAVCHCGGEVIRRRFQGIKERLNCAGCGTSWSYCTGCDQLRWPMERSEIVCGKECVSKVDTTNNIWYCKDCWRSFIIEEEVKKQN